MSDTDFSQLLSPIQIGKMTVRNRVMLTTHNPKMSEARYLAYLEERVANGVGMVGIPVLHEAISSLTFVSTGRLDANSAGDTDGTPDPETQEGIDYFDELLIPRLKARADIVHRHGAICFGQVANRGSIRLPETFQAMVSPSGLADAHVRIASHALTVDEIRRVIKLFGLSARRIMRAGVDGVEIHATHGYLVEQFLSPSTNLRTDEYGGSFDNRLRFLLELIDSIRHHCGPDFPISMRISGYQVNEGGLSNEDIRNIVTRVAPSLVYVNITAGTIGALHDGVVVPYVASSHFPPGFNVEAAANIKDSIDIPLIVTGRMNDPDQWAAVLASGKADMIGTTRALIADPTFITKIAQGRKDQIRKCIGVNECHFSDRVSSCPVNPAAGREQELRFVRSPQRKRVMVIGGGPAGMETARTAAARGHAVTLVEKSSRLGGKIATLARDPNRRDMGTYIDMLAREVRSQGVEVMLGVEATPEFVARHQPDAVVVATGATPRIPDLPGIGETRCYTALDILEWDVELGQRVLVVGGLNDHIGPPAAAETLAERGKQVVLVSECLVMGQGLEPSILHLMTKRLLEKDVQVLPLTALVEAGPAPKLRNIFSKREVDLGAFDSIVFADACEPVEFPQLEGEVYRIGDCLAPRRLVHATLDGARIGTRL